MSDSPAITDAIERVKKYTYTVGNSIGVLTPYQGADEVPLVTLDEFCRLIDGLLTSASRMAPGIDLGPLYRFRHAELSRNSDGRESAPARSSGVVLFPGTGLPPQPSPMEWGRLAVEADHLLNQLKGRLAGEKKRRSTNEDRDRYCYEGIAARKTLKCIQNEINSHESWEPLHTEQGVSQAAKRHADREKLPWPVR